MSSTNYPSAMTTQPTESQLTIFRQARDAEALKQIIETTNIDVNDDAIIAEAARCGRNEIVELLITAGADVNIIGIYVYIYNINSFIQ